MTRRRRAWMLRTFAPAACFALAAIVSALALDWWRAVIAGACALSLALAGQTQRYAYRAGFWAGVLDLTSALKTGKSPLLRGETPEPWDKLPVDHD